MKDNLKILDNIMDSYKLNNTEKEELLSMIINIFEHEEFQKRMTDKFLHHSNITLGYHILQTTTITYILCKKALKNKKDIDINLALNIAMMHDLYTVQWRKNKIGKAKRFSNLHGFRHPIESVVNSFNWYPDLFRNNEKSYELIDGIIHHMYPLPVRRIDNSIYNELELKNFALLKNIDRKYIDEMIKSCYRGKIGLYSFAMPYSIEGKIVSSADKRATFNNYNGIANKIKKIEREKYE